MNLIWTLLRQHISIPQFSGFFFANIFGLFIVLFGFQFYHDVMPVFTAGDSFMKADYIVLSKKIGATGTFSGNTKTFSNEEYKRLAEQKFVRRIGKFTSTEYRVDASMSVCGANLFNTELFFESIPDEFVEIPIDKWKFDEKTRVVPIILPRSYITMYNFGFAQSHSLPKISDGVMGMVDFNLFIRGNGHSDQYKGKIVAFSNRLNTILVPQEFMDWSNKRYVPDSEMPATRLILEVSNPADDGFAKYLEDNGYDLSDNNLDTGKTTYFLRLLVVMVITVGLIISVMSFFLLILSIYLLVQKNASKLENLLLIGYSSAKIAMPYQLLAVSLNFVALVVVWIVVCIVRSYYMDILMNLFPGVNDGSLLYSIILGVILFVMISSINIIVIRRKISGLWERAE